MKLVRTLVVTATLALGSASLAYAQTTPMADPGASQNPAVKAQGEIVSGPLAKGHNSYTKAQARGRIEKAGFTQVTGLMKDADGLWQAQAMQNGQSVNVALDFKGNVSTH